MRKLLALLKGANDISLVDTYRNDYDISVVSCEDANKDFFVYRGYKTYTSKDYFDGNINEIFDMVIGNPPYGKNASLSVKYLNKAKNYTNVISLIVPASFNKPSIINRIDSHLHCEKNTDISKTNLNINACFQQWVLKPIKREKIKTFKHHSDFEFVNKESADIALGRVGAGPCGNVYRNNFQNRSEESHYFIKVKDPSVIDKLESLTTLFRESGNQAVSVPSLSKNDLIRIYNGEYNGR